MLMYLCFVQLTLIASGKGVSYQRETLLYPELIIDIAHYFEVLCIDFLTEAQPEQDFFISKVLKEVATPGGKVSNAHSFEAYNFNKKKNKLRCDLPLRVVFSYDGATRKALMLYSQRNEMHGSDSPGGGVWLIFLNSVKEDYIEEYFKGVNTPFEVQLIIAEQQGKEVELKEVYRVRKDKPLRSQKLGKWSTEKGLELMQLTSIHYSRRSDLENITINVGYILSEPYTRRDYQNEKLILGGYFGDIWGILENTLNISTNLILEPYYGTYSSETNQWSGLIYHLSSGNFDVGIADYTLTKKRNEVISYSIPLVVTTYKVFYQSSGSSIETGVIFLPLAFDLWMSLVGWIIVAAMILNFGCYFSNTNLQTYEEMTLMNALFFVAGALCGQGGINVPKTSTCRTFFISTFVITGIIIPAYSASLVSLITVFKPLAPISDMREFFENGKTRMLVKYGSYDYELFSVESAYDPYMNKIFKRDIEPLKESDFPPSYQNAVERVCNDEGLAYFGLADAIKWAIYKDENRKGRNRKCVLSEMPLNFGKSSLGIAFPKNSHIRGVINHRLSNLPNKGILNRLKQKHWPPTQPLIGSEEHQPVPLASVIMMFAIMGYGIVSSLFCLLIELLLGKRRKTLIKEEIYSHKIRRKFIQNSTVFDNKGET